MPPSSRPLTAALDHARAAAGCGRADPADADLLARFVATRDEAAFAQLVRRHGRLVLGVARRRLADRHAAEDVVQGTFVALARQADRLRTGTALPAWLHTVAYRLARKAQAAAARRPAPGAADTPSPAADPLADVTGRELVGMIDDELARLPEAYRLPLLLCGLDGLSRDEAAARLGWTLGALRGRLERGRERLRRRLARRGIDLSAGLLGVLADASGADAAVPSDLVRATVAAATGVPSAAVAALARGAASAVLTRARLAALAAMTALVAAGAGVGLLIGSGAAPTDPPTPATPPAPPAAASAGVTVRGRVLDPAGKPVAGARLFTYRRPAEPRSPGGHPGLVQRAVTDGDGHFAFAAPGLPVHVPADQAHLLHVLAAADGFGVGWAKPARPDDEVTVRLAADQPIVGRLIDTEGRPAAAATVRVREVIRYRSGRLDGFLAGWRVDWQDALYADTDAGLSQPPAAMIRVTGPDRDGRFRVSGVGAERMAILDVSGPGLAQGVLVVVTPDGFDPGPVNRAALERTPPELREPGWPHLLYGPSLDYVAVPARPIVGTVREAGTGRPVAGAEVGCTVAYSTAIRATTDAAGRFRLDGVGKRKDYHVYISPPAGAPLIRRPFRLADTEGLQPLTADIELVRGTVLTGRVTDRSTGRGVFSDVHFYAVPADAGAGNPARAPEGMADFATSTDADGRFRLPVVPGPGVLVVRAHGTERLDDRDVTPFRPAEPDERIRTRARVMERGDGLFLTAADGSMSPLFGHAITWLDRTEGGDPPPLELSVERGRTAAVRVEDPDGRPLAGAVVSGMTATWPITFALPGADCTLHALDPRKPRTVVFYHPGRKLGGVLSARGDEAGPLTARLRPVGAAVTGRVVGGDGRPIAGATASQVFEDDAVRELVRYLAARGGRGQRTTTDADGRFRFDEVFPDLAFELGFKKGPTELVGPGGDFWFGPHRVAGGGTLDLGDLRTRPRGE